MRFCTVCGRPLQEGEVCACQGQPVTPEQYPQQTYPQQTPEMQERPQQQAVQQAVQQPVQQPAQQFSRQQPVQQPVWQAGQQPVPQKPKNDIVVKTFKNMPSAIKGYFKNSDRVIEIARDKKDHLLPAFFIAFYFVANLILSLVFFLRMTDIRYSSGLGILEGVFGPADLSDIIGSLGAFAGSQSVSLFRFHFGFALLAAIIMTVTVCALYVGSRFLVMTALGKKEPLKALLGAYVEFGFHSAPLCCLVIAAAVLGLMTPWFVVPLLGIAASYLTVMFVTASLNDSKGFSYKFVRNIILTVFITVCVAAAFFMLYLVCVMNYSDSVALNANELYNGLSGLFDGFY